MATNKKVQKSADYHWVLEQCELVQTLVSQQLLTPSTGGQKDGFIEHQKDQVHVFLNQCEQVGVPISMQERQALTVALCASVLLLNDQVRQIAKMKKSADTSIDAWVLSYQNWVNGVIDTLGVDKKMPYPWSFESDRTSIFVASELTLALQLRDKYRHVCNAPEMFGPVSSTLLLQQGQSIQQKAGVSLTSLSAKSQRALVTVSSVWEHTPPSLKQWFADQIPSALGYVEFLSTHAWTKKLAHLQDWEGQYPDSNAQRCKHALLRLALLQQSMEVLKPLKRMDVQTLWAKKGAKTWQVEDLECVEPEHMIKQWGNWSAQSNTLSKVFVDFLGQHRSQVGLLSNPYAKEFVEEGLKICPHIFIPLVRLQMAQYMQSLYPFENDKAYESIVQKHGELGYLRDIKKQYDWMQKLYEPQWSATELRGFIQKMPEKHWGVMLQLSEPKESKVVGFWRQCIMESWTSAEPEYMQFVIDFADALQSNKASSAWKLWFLQTVDQALIEHPKSPLLQYYKTKSGAEMSLLSVLMPMSVDKDHEVASLAKHIFQRCLEQGADPNRQHKGKIKSVQQRAQSVKYLQPLVHLIEVHALEQQVPQNVLKGVRKTL